MKFPKLKGNFVSLGKKTNLTDFFEKRTPRQLIMAAAAISLIFAVLIYFALSLSEKPQKQAVSSSTVMVVVAKEDIPQRTTIQESMLKVVAVPSELMPAGALTDMGSAVGRPASVPIQQGDVLTDKKVYSDSRMTGFAGSIPEDCRAISIGITDVTGVAGFAKPGDYVDVMLISEKKDEGRVSGEIILQNVLLLAINKTPNSAAASPSNANPPAKAADKAKDDKKDGTTENANAALKDALATATLALRPEEALRLAVAAKAGELYLILRPFKPNNMFVLDTDYFLLKSADSSNAASQAAKNPPAAPAQSAYSYPAASAPVQPAASPTSAPAYSSGNSGGSGTPSWQSVEIFRGTSSSRAGGK